eukprot:5050466-Alexandrium_andersonii.AAC.1
MSASLVGSEMCIRDRVGASAPCRLAPAYHKVLASSRPADMIPASSTRSVSYTHLTLPTICSV